MMCSVRLCRGLCRESTRMVHREPCPDLTSSEAGCFAGGSVTCLPYIEQANLYNVLDPGNNFLETVAAILKV
ncbi:MAG: hypothetical protein R3C02_10490 [Planctomycetaceae bacterium]